MKGVKISSFIIPMSPGDTYPTNLDIFGKGGIHSISGSVERDAITSERRSQGMFSFTQDNQSMFTLLGGVTNDKWVKLFDFSNDTINFNISCKPNYVMLGDKSGTAKPSPKLRDVEFALIDLRRRLDSIEDLDNLTYNKIWVGDFFNNYVEQLHIGVINLPILGAATFPYPSIIPLPAIPIPNPTFNPFSGFDWLMSGPWLPQIFAGNTNTLNTSSETVISSSLAMTQVNVAQAIKRLDTTGFIVKTKTIDFSWDNPLISLIPSPIRDLYNLNTSHTFTNAQALDEIGAGLLKNSAEGALSLAVAGKDYVDVDIPVADRVPLWGIEKKLVTSNIQVIKGLLADDVRGVNSLKADLLQAVNCVTSDKNMIVREEIICRDIFVSDYNPAHRQNYYVKFKGPESLPPLTSLTWRLPSQTSTTGQVLGDIGKNLENERLLGFFDVLKGPDSSKDNSIALFHGTNGQKLKESKATIDVNGNIYANSINFNIIEDRFYGINVSPLTAPGIFNWTLPKFNGFIGWVLTTDGFGNLTWSPQIPTKKVDNEDGEEVKNPDGISIFVPIGISVIVGALSFFTDATGAIIGASAATADSLGNVTIPKDLNVAQNAEISNNLKVDTINANDVSLNSISTEASELDISISNEGGVKFEGLKFDFDPTSSTVKSSFGGDIVTQGNISSGGGFASGGQVTAVQGFSTPAAVNAVSVSAGTVKTGTGGLVLGATSPTSYTIGMIAPTGLSSSYIINLPSVQGTAGQILSTNSLGKWEWINGGSGGNIDLKGEVVANGALNTSVDTTVNWSFVWKLLNNEIDIQWE